jgi:peptide deformylase
VNVAILKVARIGHPVVRMAAAPVREEDIATPAFQRLVDDMIVTMHEYDGVGLAAPQVHVSLRVAVIEVPASGGMRSAPPHEERARIHSARAEDERSHAAVPLTVLVNPVVTPLGDERVSGWEGCLSVPGLRGVVPRFNRVRLEALDREGRPYAAEASGFFARVIQHECDHLGGKVYLDRMEDMRTLSFLRELHRHVPDAEEEED